MEILDRVSPPNTDCGTLNRPFQTLLSDRNRDSLRSSG